MKKLLSLLFLLIGLTLTSQTVTYQPSNTVIANPEKGFYHYTSTGSSGGYNLLNKSTIAGYRTTENITVIQRQFFLRDFITGIPITSTYLTNMQTDFNRIRNAGAKVLVRFTYTSSSSYTVFQPTKAQILAHITQLAPVVNANKDVIVAIQAGFIGKYGEWYYTGSSEFGTSGTINNTQWQNRNDILTACETAFSSEIPLQVRYVDILQKLRPTGTNRIGIYNDAFLNTWGDQGTFSVNCVSCTNPLQEQYLQNLTVNLPMTGETDGVNSPRTDCPNAMIEMDRYNWSLINKDYLPTNITNWQTNGCFTTMQKNLGYNFRLNNSTLANGILTINIGNYGYANLFKSRKAFLVCKNTSTNVNYSYVIDTDFKRCISTNYTISVNMGQIGLPTGTYKLFLNLPDPLINNKLYSIQTSNLNTWTTEGFNDLQQTYIVNGLNTVGRMLEIRDEDIIDVNIYNFNGFLISKNSNLTDLQSDIYIVVVKTKTGRVVTRKIKI